MDYKNGKIYRIVCNETGLCYIGSTTSTLVKRLSKHKSDFKAYLEGNKNYITSYKIIENNNYDIILLEEFPCENKNQLYKRERFYIESIDCVNKIIPSRTQKEYREDNKEHLKEKTKQYNEKNKEEIKEYKKEYYEKNKDKVAEIQHNWYLKNKEEIKEQHKEYNENNKKKIKEYYKEYYENNKKKLMLNPNINVF